MTKFRLVTAEALRSIGANLSTTFASAVSVLIGMLLIGVFIGIGTWLVSWSDDKKRELAVHVYFCGRTARVRGRGDAQADQSGARVPRVGRSREAGRDHFHHEGAGPRDPARTPELTENLVRNPLPASFDVVPRRGEDTEAIALPCARRSSQAHVVRYGQEVSERILQVAR